MVVGFCCCFYFFLALVYHEVHVELNIDKYRVDEWFSIIFFRVVIVLLYNWKGIVKENKKWESKAWEGIMKI